MSERLICLIADCDRPVERDDLCATHRKRLQRGSTAIGAPIPERPTSAFGVLQEAALSLADAELDSDYERAKARLEAAAKAYARRVEAGRGITQETQRDGGCQHTRGSVVSVRAAPEGLSGGDSRVRAGAGGSPADGGDP